MTLICEKLDLDPKKTTQSALIGTFTQLQADAVNSREYLRKQLKIGE
ncbi:MAG: hypothetical protein [Microvirus sp.]|nr:MAG: hypothetical protein [Microvirus sp.]